MRGGLFTTRFKFTAGVATDCKHRLKIDWPVERKRMGVSVEDSEGHMASMICEEFRRRCVLLRTRPRLDHLGCAVLTDIHCG